MPLTPGEQLFLERSFEIAFESIAALDARVAALEPQPVAAITVGDSGADFDDLHLAIEAAADNNAQIYFVDDLLNQPAHPNGNELINWHNGKHDLRILQNGFRINIDSGDGEAFAFYDCKRLYWSLGSGGVIQDMRSTKGNTNAIVIGFNCKWTIIDTGATYAIPGQILDFSQGIATLAGHYMDPNPITTVRRASTEHIWCDGLVFRDIGEQHSTGPSGISYYQLNSVPDDATSSPPRWRELLLRHGFPTTNKTLVACITNCAADGVVYNTGLTSDHNGFILADDWEAQQDETGRSLLATDYCNGIRRAFSANCAARNTSGAGLRLYDSVNPFIVRGFTSYETGRGRLSPLWGGAALSVGNKDNDGTDWHGQFSNCLAVRCGAGGADDFDTSGVGASPTDTQWIRCREHDSLGGAGWGFTNIADPVFAGVSDVLDLIPAAGGSADNAAHGGLVDPVDFFLNARPAPASLGFAEAA